MRMASPWRADHAMLDWVEMDVIAMSRNISLITDRVLPKSLLPNPTLALGYLGGRAAFTPRNFSLRNRA
jgi:hypothetical protein